MCDMGLFKKQRRTRIEREMKIRQGCAQLQVVGQQEIFRRLIRVRTECHRRSGDQNQYCLFGGRLRRLAARQKRCWRGSCWRFKECDVDSSAGGSSRQFAESIEFDVAESQPVFGSGTLSGRRRQWERAWRRSGAWRRGWSWFGEVDGSRAVRFRGVDASPNEQCER